MRQHKSPGHRHTKTAVLSLKGFTVGLHEVSSSVRRRLGEEDGSVGGRCSEALKKLLVETLLVGGDNLLVRSAIAEGWAKWPKEEGRLVHLL